MESHTQSTTRRAVLAGIAAAPAITATFAAPNALASTDDPILRLIEEHRASEAAYELIGRLIGAYEEADRTDDGRLPKAADHPKLARLEARGDEICAANHAITTALVTTPPTTLAGAAALVRYIQTASDGGYNILQVRISVRPRNDDGRIFDDDYILGLELLMASLARSLESLAVQS